MNIGSTMGSVMQTSAVALPPTSNEVQKSTKQVDDTSIDRPVEDIQALVKNVTDMKQGQQQSDANTKVMQVVDETLGNLVDTSA